MVQKARSNLKLLTPSPNLQWHFTSGRVDRHSIHASLLTEHDHLRYTSYVHRACVVVVVVVGWLGDENSCLRTPQDAQRNVTGSSLAEI